MSDQKEVVHTSKPQDGQCEFYLERKKRFCRFRPKQGQKFCAEHSVGCTGEDQEYEKRILCPLNPKHSCFESKLEKHLKKCASNPANQKSFPFYSEGINSGCCTGEREPSPKVTLVTASVEQIQKLIEKINKLYEEYKPEIETEILTHSCLDDELKNPFYRTPAIRQRKQQASLIGHIERLGALKSGNCYLEMGAGKGQLSHWIQKAVGDSSDTLFILVDKGHSRYKFDGHHKDEESGPKFHRLCIDIEHLNLCKVPQIKDENKPLVVTGKHLCGAATDLALRCIMERNNIQVGNKDINLQTEKQTAERDNDESAYCDREMKIKKLKTENRVEEKDYGDRLPAAIVIALCCHHRCSWTSYVGKKFILDNGFSAEDFQLLTSMGSWAICTWKGWKSEKQPGNEQTEEDENNDDVEHEGCEQITTETNEKLSIEERESIGAKCKRLLDIGRMKYLQNLGYKCELKAYIDSHLTPENVAIIAVPVS